MRRPATRSVADMPPVMRRACEYLVEGYSDADIGRGIGVSAGTVTAHLAAARKRTGTKTRGELAAWCKAGRNLRGVLAPAPHFNITATDTAGRRVVVLLHSALEDAARLYPNHLLAAAALIHEKRDREQQRQTATPDKCTPDISAQ